MNRICGFRWPEHVLIAMIVLVTGLACNVSRAQEGILEQTQQLGDRYKVELVLEKTSFPVTITHGEIDGATADERELKLYLKLFVEEFAIYPTQLVEMTGLKRIVFCKSLSFAGQLRGAIPDFENDTLYLDVQCAGDNWLYLRKVIHHEYFHIIDYKDDGEVYRDDVWSRLNAPDFNYGSGGINAQDMPTTSVLTEKFPGFLNHYSTTGVEEDKAELFANLIVDAAYVGQRIEKNVVLGNKFRHMKRSLADFCPEVNDEFWERAANLPRAAEMRLEK